MGALILLLYEFYYVRTPQEKWEGGAVTEG